MNKLANVMARTVQGTQIIALKNYTNKKGEISNYSVVIGYNHAAMKEREVKALQAVNLAEIKGHDSALLEVALNELITSRTMNPDDNAHIQGQLEVYTTLAKGVKQHDSMGVKIHGVLLSKKHIGFTDDYVAPKPVNSNAKTKAKRDIEKAAKKFDKRAFMPIVMFNLDNEAFEIKMQKATIS